MSAEINAARSPHPERGLLLALAAVVPVVQVIALAVSSADYSYFIDEFYYIACSKRLAFGYVDHPPLAPLLLTFTRALLGDSLFAIRLPAFLAAGATVWLAGRLVLDLGGGRFAAILAALAFGLAPGFLGMTSFYSMNALEPLIWTALMVTLVRLASTGDAKLWLLAGALVGIGFENKHTIVAYVAALGIAIVVTMLVSRAGARNLHDEARARNLRGEGPWNLRDKWMWAGAGIALLLALPNVAWQIANGWPSLEFYHNAQVLKNVSSPPLRSLSAQVQFMNPLALPVWLAGLAWLLTGRDRRHLRFAGVMFVVLLAMHVASRTSRPDRILAAYPLVFAAGGVAIERLVRRSALRAGYVTLLVATSVALLPVVLPVLPPALDARYVAALGVVNNIEKGKTAPIMQLLADRTGWRSFLDDLVRAYRTLSPEDRRRAIIYLPDYGHAGATELWGPAAGLPRAIASQNTYWHWSEGHTNSPVLVAVGASPERLRKIYGEVARVGTVRCEYCMSWRSNMPIFVATHPIAPSDPVWRLVRHYE